MTQRDDPILYGKRLRLEELAAREAAGESFWTDALSPEVRVEVHHAVTDCAVSTPGTVRNAAERLVLRSERLLELPTISVGYARDQNQFWPYFYNCDSVQALTVIEALVDGFRVVGNEYRGGDQTHRLCFEAKINTILRENRVSYELVSSRLVPFQSREMHVSVVAPTISLLGGRSEFAGAEAAYLDALREISQSNPADAITDVGRALQELLTSLGCQGNALGDLIKSAKNKGFLAAHDATFTDGLTKILHWVSAERSTTGDAHVSTAPSIEDAWFAVHITGALILRLAGGPPRGTPKS